MQSDQAPPPQVGKPALPGSSWNRPRGRIAIAVTVALLILLGFAVNVISQQGPYAFIPGPGPYIPAQDLDALKAQVTKDYPGWTIQDVTVDGRGPGWVFYEEVGATVVLKAPAPENFYIAVDYPYGSPQDHPADWTNSHYPSLFQNPADAQGFITAFKARHPGPDWLVTMYSDRSAIRSAGPDGLLIRVNYLRLADYPLKEGHTSAAHLETWRATDTSAGVVWQLAGP